MSFRLKSRRSFTQARTALLLLATLVAISASTIAQAPAAATAPPSISRFDLYGGYGYINPRNSHIGVTTYQPIDQGAVFSATAYFNRYLGVQAEGSIFPNGPNDCINTAQAGPVLRLQKGRFVPFLHVLGGGAKVGGPVFQPCTWGWGATGGLGLDFILPAFHNHLALRPIQADYNYSRVDYGPVDPTQVTGGLGIIHGYKLSGGLVLRFGELNPPVAVQLGCSVEPANIYPGDPVTVSADTSNLRPGKTTYNWTTTGGQLAHADQTTTIDTTGLAPGDYTVTGHITQGSHSTQQASCTTGFRVHGFDPPTISCSANPVTIKPGDSSTITAQATSPQNRALTYSYSATAGQISGAAPTATLATVGASPGPIIVTCNVVDDRGQQASASTQVTISTPPPPAPPPPVALCAVSFDRDKKRPDRVDNEAKGCLDEIALTLNRDSAAKLVIIGRHSEAETPDAAAERTLNVQQYLVLEKGIDASRIELRTRGESGKLVENVLLPAGASFLSSDTATFDATTVKRHGQPYGIPHPPSNAPTPHKRPRQPRRSIPPQ